MTETCREGTAPGLQVSPSPSCDPALGSSRGLAPRTPSRKAGQCWPAPLCSELGPSHEHNARPAVPGARAPQSLLSFSGQLRLCVSILQGQGGWGHWRVQSILTAGWGLSSCHHSSGQALPASCPLLPPEGGSHRNWAGARPCRQGPLPASPQRRGPNLPDSSTPSFIHSSVTESAAVVSQRESTDLSPLVSGAGRLNPQHSPGEQGWVTWGGGEGGWREWPAPPWASSQWAASPNVGSQGQRTPFCATARDQHPRSLRCQSFLPKTRLRPQTQDMGHKPTDRSPPPPPPQAVARLNRSLCSGWACCGKPGAR